MHVELAKKDAEIERLTTSLMIADANFNESVDRHIKDTARIVELEAENRGLTEIRKTQDIFLDAAKGYIAQLEEVVEAARTEAQRSTIPNWHALQEAIAKLDKADD
jgi:acyl CoA:acetate/3-ketoacid CoA transferase alpha subunit